MGCGGSRSGGEDAPQKSTNKNSTVPAKEKAPNDSSDTAASSSKEKSSKEGHRERGSSKSRRKSEESNEKGSPKAGVAKDKDKVKDKPTDKDADKSDAEDDDDSGKKPIPKRNRRCSVSAEPTSEVMKSQKDVKRVVIPKSEEQRRAIVSATQANFLFSNVESQQYAELVDAMEEVKTSPGDVVIRQGDAGDFFYVVDKGEYEISIKFGNESRVVFVAKKENIFGELALMYNTPRAATVKCSVAGRLWRLDRDTFRRIIVENTMRKRKLYESFLDSLPLLANLTPNERTNCADALTSVSYINGEHIITEGEIGQHFYFVEEGEVSVTRKREDGGEPIEVNRIKQGGYFGEMALLKDAPRAANVIAHGDVRCAVMDAAAFIRLLGPLQDIMQRSMADYKRPEEIAEDE